MYYRFFSLLRFIPILTIIMLPFICSCSSFDTVRKNIINASYSDLFWPAPPQTPRIQYIGNIFSLEYKGSESNLFNKVSKLIFGEQDSRQILFLRPYGIFAETNSIYVTDAGASLLHIFNLKDNKYRTVDIIGGTELISPIGISVDEKSLIYLSDSALKRVIVLTDEGEYLRDIGSPDMFVRPAGITIDKEHVYVVDTHAHKVLVFSKDKGTLLFSFGKNGKGAGDFNYPTHISIGENGNLYITDSMNFRIQIFDRYGNFISSFGKAGDGLGDFSKPKGIAVDSDGHIYVVDAHFDTVQIFDQNGKLLLTFGNSGTGNGEFILPAGIFIDETDRIYVADSYNKRVQIFQYLR